MIRARSFSFLMAFLVLGAGACGDDDEGTTEPTTLARLEGSWTTSSFTYTSLNNSAITTGNLAANNLGITSMDIAANGNFTGTVILPPPIGQQQVTGTITEVGNQLRVTFTGAAAQIFEPFDADFEFTSNNVFEFSTDDVTFDYSPFGGPSNEPSLLAISMTRVSS